MNEDTLLAMSRGNEPERCSIAARIVCDHYGITEEQLLSHVKTGAWAWPRLVAYWLATDAMRVSLHGAGRWFGRDHASISYGKKKIQDAIATMPILAKRLEELKRKAVE